MSERSKKRGGIHTPKRRGEVEREGHNPLSDPERRPTCEPDSTQRRRGGRAHAERDLEATTDPLYRSIEELYQRLKCFAKAHAQHLSHAGQTWLREALGQVELSLIQVAPLFAPGARARRSF